MAFGRIVVWHSLCTLDHREEPWAATNPGTGATDRCENGRKRKHRSARIIDATVSAETKTTDKEG